MTEPRILICGECWDRQDAAAGMPFKGAGGYALKQMLSQVGIDMQRCYLTNVLNFEPSGRDFAEVCGGKAEGIPGYPALGSGKYVRAEYAPEVARLHRELTAYRPDLIIALGALATWAILRIPSINKVRGFAVASQWGKVLATYSPTSMLRDYTLRPVILSDLEKATYESAFPEIRRPQRFIHIEPSLADLDEFYEQYIRGCTDLSVDIETKGRHVEVIGFAPSRDRALVVPFIDPTQPDGNYWRSHSEEVAAWRWVRKVLDNTRNIVGQNFLYDAHFLWREAGVPTPMIGDDTMLLHHALQPEMKKGLGFLATLYTREPAWKFMRGAADTNKREDT